MGNERRSRVIRMGNVELKFTCGNKVTLVNIHLVPCMNMNLVSGDLLGKLDIKYVYELSKLILTCNIVFMGKGYSIKGMVKLCTIDNIINKVSIFTYMLESVSLWRSRLSHIGISTMKRLIKSGLISRDVNNLKNVKYMLNQI